LTHTPNYTTPHTHTHTRPTTLHLTHTPNYTTPYTLTHSRSPPFSLTHTNSLYRHTHTCVNSLFFPFSLPCMNRCTLCFSPPILHTYIHSTYQMCRGVSIVLW